MASSRVLKPSHEQDEWVCNLCKRTGPCISEGLGGFIKPITSKNKTVIVHRFCAALSPQVEWDVDAQKFKSVLIEVRRGNKLVRAPGKGSHSLTRATHLPCSVNKQRASN